MDMILDTKAWHAGGSSSEVLCVLHMPEVSSADQGRPPALVEGPRLAESGMLESVAGQQGSDDTQGRPVARRGQAARVADSQDASLARARACCLDRLHDGICPMLADALQAPCWSWRCKVK